MLCGFFQLLSFRQLTACCEYQSNWKQEATGCVQMKPSACKRDRALIQLMRTQDKMPEESADYEPSFFRRCTEEETHIALTKNPLEMEVGNVVSTHVMLASVWRLKVCLIRMSAKM